MKIEIRFAWFWKTDAPAQRGFKGERVGIINRKVIDKNSYPPEYKNAKTVQEIVDIFRKDNPDNTHHGYPIEMRILSVYDLNEHSGL